METELSSLRQEYRKRSLHKGSMKADPIKQFGQWLRQALRAEVTEPNAMTLATVSEDGRPSARMVLLKEVSSEGFTFFTNYNSRKARELNAVPHAALVFWWQELERQVRIEGSVERVSEELSDRYFETRPRASQIGSWASPQSEVVDHRSTLEKQVEEMQQRFQGKPIPRPPNWGGYRLVPSAIEFWQGREGRVHDRFYYSRSEKGNWQLQRLGP